MLFKLSIGNYALIQELEIDFAPGLSVITGETGAGKSILLGALSLILGQRADTGVLLDPARKCIVEGSFNIEGYNLEDFFESNELDFDNIISLRREINQNGKSRAFINDTPVGLGQLKELGDRLVNIHSQHAIVTLNDISFQLALLDNYAGLTSAVSKYRKGYLELTAKLDQIDKLHQLEEKARGDRDYYAFLLDEMIKANLLPGEQEEAEHRLTILTHAGEIKTALFRSHAALSSGEISSVNLTTEAVHELTTAGKFGSDVNSLIDRLKSVLIEIKDIANEIDLTGERIQTDPGEAELITQRLDLIYRLHKKHHTSNLDDLLALQLQIKKKLSESDDLDLMISTLEKEAQGLREGLQSQATEISGRRRGVVAQLEKEITATLGKLGMARAKFVIDCQTQEALSRDGFDKIKFLFSANAGTEVSEIARIASGGELSRLMLSLKSMISQKNLLPTIIFDEIDNGVSGDIAGKVAKILLNMAGKMQVIVITHLPQIAAKGENHFRVFKREEHQQTLTGIRLLSSDERVEEVAKMLSDETVTEAAMKAAKELIDK
jgi:DNA repair protein RecN (Recombination protein N)